MRDRNGKRGYEESCRHFKINAEHTVGENTMKIVSEQTQHEKLTAKKKGKTSK